MASEFKKLVQHFTSPRDARLAHPALDTEAPMTKSEFENITGSYTFPRAEWVTCQLEVEGNVCKQSHGAGWIMLRKDGVEGYIGGDCAKGHFQADEAFAGATAKARRDRRTLNLVERLGLLLTDRETLRQRIQDIWGRQQDLHKEVRALREQLPYALLDRLHSMTKTGDRAIRLEFGYVEKDEDRDGKVIEVTRYRPDTVGTVVAPQALESHVLESIDERLRTALAACNQAEASTDRTEAELRGWAEAIESVERCEANLDEAASAWAAFIEPTNLRGLCWLCRKAGDQLQTATIALKMAGMRAREADAERVRREWREQLQASHSRADFRIP